LALRHQLGVYRRTCRRPCIRAHDRIFWSWLSRVWSGWRETLVIVRPETVIAWRRKKFREYWARLCRSEKPGRPAIPKEIRDLIRRMSLANPLWGVPHIVGELSKIGIDLHKSTVAKYMVRRRKPPSQTWKSFLVLHFNITTNPTARWTAQQIVNAFPWDEAPHYLLRDRDKIYGAFFQRRVKNMGIEQVATAPRSPWQNPFVERLIGTIRRECLDHVVVLNERHLRRILSSYFDYSHRYRVHQSLAMDCPAPRDVHSDDRGRVVEIGHFGGLHHHYERVVA